MSHVPSIHTIKARFAAPPEISDSLGASVPFGETPPGKASAAAPADDVPPLPKALAKLLAERKASVVAAQTTFHPLGHPGQIVRVSAASFVFDQQHWLNEPLAVLLDVALDNQRWCGWLVSRDPGYASEWDLLLGPEEDPKDPMCQSVQIWNPVTLKLQLADRVLAELSSERLAAARMMAVDYARKCLPVPIQDHRMGVHLARELSEGTGVVTGTPVMESNDPRREYQTLYAQAAAWLGEASLNKAPAAAAAPASPPQAELKGTLAWLRQLFSHRPYQAAWGGALAFSVLAVVALQIISTPEHPGESPMPERYISGGAMQDIQADHPEESAQQVEQRLRQLGAVVELRYEAGGMITLQTDLSALSASQRTQFFREFAALNIQPVAGTTLKLTFIPRRAGKDAP